MLRADTDDTEAIIQAASNYIMLLEHNLIVTVVNMQKFMLKTLQLIILIH